MPRLSRLALLLSLTFAAGHAVAGPEEDQRARNAVRVLNEIMKIPSRRSRTSCSTRRAPSWSSPTRSRPGW